MPLNKETKPNCTKDNLQGKFKTNLYVHKLLILGKTLYLHNKYDIPHKCKYVIVPK